MQAATRAIAHWSCVLGLHVAWFCLVWASGESMAFGQTWVEDSFEDFRDGTFDDGGQNIYVSRDGTLRTINRFDLNDDGHVDLIFNCTHNTFQMVSATCGTADRDRHATSTEIAVEGSQRVAIADLNQDGFKEAVFCPNGIGVAHPRRFVSIAWGASDGWSASRVASGLAHQSPFAVTVADVNADGWPEIVALGAARWQLDQPEGNILRIFWGSPSGYLTEDYLDLGVPSALDLATADFDQDHAADLAILRGDDQVTLLWGRREARARDDFSPTEVPLLAADATCLVAADVNGDQRLDLVAGSSEKQIRIVEAGPGRTWQPAATVPAFSASHVTVGDVDKDNFADLVLTKFSMARASGGEQAGAGDDAEDRIRVLWGGPAGFDAQRNSEFPIRYAVATALGDMDGNGQTDLVVAVHQSDNSFHGKSVVFYNLGRREFLLGEQGFDTAGTTHVAVAQEEDGLPARAVFANSIGGLHDELVPLHVYWGSSQGFDPDRIWKIPFRSGYEASSADLNADGFVDLVALNSGHLGEISLQDPHLGANIFWGAKDGFDLEHRRSVLHEAYLGTSTVADLDRDGYLDLVLEGFGAEKPGTDDLLVIHYGCQEGLGKGRRVSLASPGYSQEHVVADWNRDGWLDIADTSKTLNRVRILWGGPDGFDDSRSATIKVSGPIGMRTADLNADGVLDLIVSSYDDAISKYRDMGTVIFWGSSSGFSQANSQWMPGFSPLGRCVADFDGDGHLDLFLPQHSGELTREDLACYIHWGSDQGFATRRRTSLFCNSVGDSVACDFNGDGRLDLAVSCHTKHGDHRTVSKVFYNDGQRFANPRIDNLPTNGTHLMWAMDMGHIYHRRYQHVYESSTYAYRKAFTKVQVQLQADVPEKSSWSLEIRSSPTADALHAAAWRNVREKSASVALEDRFLQYRITFASENGDRYPTVDRVSVKFLP